MKKAFRIFNGCAVAAVVWTLVLGLSHPASAISINGDMISIEAGDIGSIFDITYICSAGTPCNGNPLPFDVLGSTRWTVMDLSETEATLKIEVSNDTDPTQGASRLTAFGVGIIDPEPKGASVVQDSIHSTNWDAAVDKTFPGFQKVDLCVFAGPNCAGSGSNGLESGEIDILTLILSGKYMDGLSLKTFPIKYQSVGPEGISIEFAGTPGIPTPPPDAVVPEPGTLLLMGSGLMGLGGRLYYRCRRTPRA